MSKQNVLLVEGKHSSEQQNANVDVGGQVKAQMFCWCKENMQGKQSSAQQNVELVAKVTAPMFCWWRDKKISVKHCMKQFSERLHGPKLIKEHETIQRPRISKQEDKHMRTNPQTDNTVLSTRLCPPFLNLIMWREVIVNAVRGDFQWQRSSGN
jgi:hypothetical protein